MFRSTLCTFLTQRTATFCNHLTVAIIIKASGLLFRGFVRFRAILFGLFIGRWRDDLTSTIRCIWLTTIRSILLTAEFIVVDIVAKTVVFVVLSVAMH